MIWDSVIKSVLGIIDKVVPDPTAKAEMQLKLLQMEKDGELAYLKADTDLAVKQIEVNIEEAKSQDPFVSRWRPAAGWVCVASFAYEALARPLLPFLLQVLQVPDVPELPSVDMAVQENLLWALLGLGGLRTFDKSKWGVTGK